MSKPKAGQRTSDAELGARILAGWERMARVVPDGPRHNRRLAERLGVPLRDVEHVRDTRNRVAHPGETIGRHDLERAVSIIRRADGRGGPARRRGRRPAGSPARNGRTARPPAKARKGNRRRARGGRMVAVAVIVGVLVVLVVLVALVR